jgi:hypothetical protein
MNDPNDCRLEPDDDPALEALLSRVRAIEPPLAARIKSRLAVTEALESLANVTRRSGLPWWRRSVSVPLPVAACFLLVCALGVASRFRGDDGTSPVQTSMHDQRAQAAHDASGERAAVTATQFDARPVLVYRESATYLCGIGQLKSTHGYFFKEQDR